MRIISWNIRAGGGRRVAEISKQLAGWQPNLVALSEFHGTPPSQQLAANLKAAGLNHQLSTVMEAAPKTNALLLASDRPLQRLRLKGEPQESQRWLLAEVKSSRPFTIGVMHVPNRVSGRKYDFLDAVLAMAKQWPFGPALFIGDTNSGVPGIDEENPAFNAQEQGWLEGLGAAGWPDMFRRLHGQTRAFTWYSPNGKNGFRLDQAFVNLKLLPQVVAMRYEWGQPENANTRRDALSDHAAIILDLKPEV